MELQYRHWNQCAGDQLFGERQAVRRGAGGRASTRQHHAEFAGTEEYIDSLDTVSLQPLTIPMAPVTAPMTPARYPYRAAVHCIEHPLHRITQPGGIAPA